MKSSYYYGILKKGGLMRSETFFLHRMFGVLLFFLFWILVYIGTAHAQSLTFDDKKDIALEVTRLFRASRAVISQNQKLINDPNLGDKGLTGPIVIEKALENYKNSTGKNFNMANKEKLKGQVQKGILDATREVMNNAQPLINQRGLAFKRFLPAIFARQVAESFNQFMKFKTYIKLTAPRDFLRNRTNRADNWENNVIEKIFKAANHEKNKPYFESAPHKGRPAFRFILPEYYKKSCLGCHGEPKGERDITGGHKEGGKLGELAGAISFAIYE